MSAKNATLATSSKTFS